ncbi:hypothetical protein DFS34DRAFT_605548, partial [Phlyctochytrium arcticum]
MSRSLPTVIELPAHTQQRASAELVSSWRHRLVVVHSTGDGIGQQQVFIPWQGPGYRDICPTRRAYLVQPDGVGRGRRLWCMHSTGDEIGQQQVFIPWQGPGYRDSCPTMKHRTTICCIGYVQEASPEIWQRDLQLKYDTFTAHRNLLHKLREFVARADISRDRTSQMNRFLFSIIHSVFFVGHLVLYVVSSLVNNYKYHPSLSSEESCAL